MALPLRGPQLQIPTLMGMDWTGWCAAPSQVWEALLACHRASVHSKLAALVHTAGMDDRLLSMQAAASGRWQDPSLEEMCAEDAITTQFVIQVACQEEIIHVHEALQRSCGQGKAVAVAGISQCLRFVLPCRQAYVDVVLSDIGVAHAALCATIMCSSPSGKPTALISCGCAGAHDAELVPGDVVVGTAVAAPGQRKEMKDGEVEYSGFRCTVHDALGLTILCNQELLEAACACGSQVDLPRWPFGVAKSPVLRRGVVASSDTW